MRALSRLVGRPVWPDAALLKAIAMSLAVHLSLIALIQPAPRQGAVAVVLQARMATSPQRHAPAPAGAKAIEPQPPPSAEAAAYPSAPSPPSLPAPPEPATAPQPANDADHSAEPMAVGRESEGEEVATAASGPTTRLPEIPVMLDTRWYTAREVDQRPVIMGSVLPVYPEEARMHGIQGSVVIEVHIDEGGQVYAIAILEADPPGVFEAAVLNAYAQARFTPAILQGRPVRYRGKYLVRFELN